MNTKKWKSVLVPRATYEELVAVAYIEGRTIGGQLRMMFDFWKTKNLSENDMRVLTEQVQKNKVSQKKEADQILAEAVKKETEEAFRKAGIETLRR
jgi:sortase (surface protein transpeptidase)